MRRSFDIAALEPWIEERFGQASGPGGQNVNKVSSRVILLSDFEQCAALRPADREAIRARLATRLARDGRLRIVSQQQRSQAANRVSARTRLIELLEEATFQPTPRRPTRPSRGAKARRLRAKRQRGEIKTQRRTRPGADSD
jgi:ribosome-associated protein